MQSVGIPSNPPPTSCSQNLLGTWQRGGSGMRRPIKTDVDVAENNNNANVVDLKKIKIK